MLKPLFVVFAFMSASVVSPAQTPLSSDDALGQIYKAYDPAKHESKWVCTATQKSTDPATRDGWPCEEGQVARISLVLISQVQEGHSWKTYVVASASPGEDPRDYGCHLCSPAIGVAVFEWKDEQWHLQNANAAVGFYGSYGGGPDTEVVDIGPARHGLILWTSGGGQGYHGSEKHLIAPVGDRITEIWTLGDETDNSGAYDPADKFASHRRYYAEAAFKFVYVGNDDFYDIIAMSRGTDPAGVANWTEQYRFRDGKYRLLRRTKYSEHRLSYR